MNDLRIDWKIAGFYLAIVWGLCLYDATIPIAIVWTLIFLVTDLILMIRNKVIRQKSTGGITK